MIRYFFRETDKPLFGVYLPPKSPTPQDAGVLICPPIAHEYMRSHWACRQLANLLSRAGFHVFKFDYFATGDSAGRSDEANIQQWQQDITAAVEELKAVAGVRQISLLGVRFGALLAAYAATADSRIETLVLWDPVISGRAYRDALIQAHRAQLGNLDRFPVSRLDEPGVLDEQMLGFPYKQALQTEMVQRDLQRLSWHGPRKIWLAASHEHPEYRQLAKQIAAENPGLEYRLVPDPGCDYAAGGSISQLLPNDILQAMVKMLADAS